MTDGEYLVLVPLLVLALFWAILGVTDARAANKRIDEIEKRLRKETP